MPQLPESTFTRRRALGLVAPSAAAVVFAPQALAAGLGRAAKTPAFKKGSFAEGVMSGDPDPTGITLWTRLKNVEGAGSVTLEVAKDKNFKGVVARKTIGTSATLDHAAKARVTGLKPYEEYYYRFDTKSTHSEVGRFRTALPADSKQPVKFAFYSCQDYTHGYYNALSAMAKEDVDFVICLGDYIYAEAYHSTKDGTGVRNDPIGTAATLAQYRSKYKLYRTDPALRKVHQNFPLVTLWDDHEVEDNYAGGAGADGGLPADKKYTVARRNAGYRAFFDSMPYYPVGKSRVYRAINYGSVVDLIVMDQRQYRANQPCDDAVAPACADWNTPRAFLGTQQMDFVKNRLSTSKGTWKIMANEVMIMPTKVLGDSYYTFDSWQGYPTEREELLTHIGSNAIKNVVFVTGDIHTFVTGDVRTNMGQGDTVATEFVGGSITSQSLGETDLDAGGGITLKGNDANPATDPGIITTLRGVNPWVDQADFDHHGYGLINATPDNLTCELVRMNTIKQKSTQKLDPTEYTYTLAAGGSPSIKGVHGPAT